MNEAAGIRHCWLNGRLLPVDAARIAPDDRGFLLGDGLFETLLADGGALAFLDAHFERLRAGAQALGIPLAADKSEIARAAAAVLAAEGLDAVDRSAAVRITLTRGPGARGLLPSSPISPTLLITAARLEIQTPGPARLVLATERRFSGSIQARYKTLSYLGNVMARREAAAAGADEALVLNEHGRICGASAANIFALIGSTLVTPPITEGALPGVTRDAVMDAAQELGMPFEGSRLAVDEILERAKLVFLSSSLVGLRRVEALDGQAFGHGGGVSTSRDRGQGGGQSRGSDGGPGGGRGGRGDNGLGVGQGGDLDNVDGRALFVALRTRYEEMKDASCAASQTGEPA